MKTSIRAQAAPMQASHACPLHLHQLFADACNSASMARWYTKRGNLAAAARKSRQHLAALYELGKLQAISATMGGQTQKPKRLPPFAGAAASLATAPDVLARLADSPSTPNNTQ